MIVKVISNVKHNGTKHEAGDEFDLDSKYIKNLKGIVEPVEDQGSEVVNLENKNRKSLDKIAKSVGIKNPEELKTNQDVIDAITDKSEKVEETDEEEAQEESSDDSDNGEEDNTEEDEEDKE